MGFGRGRLDANLLALEIGDPADLLLAVEAAHALRAEADDVDALRGLVDHVADRLEHPRIAERFDDVIRRAEQEM